MKRLRRFCWEVAVLALAWGMTPADGQPALDEGIAHAAASVVGVRPLAQHPWSGEATGVCVDSEGHIVTSASRVYGADRIELCPPDAEAVEARLVGIDCLTDTAVLRADTPLNLPCRPPRGDVAFALGEEIAIVAAPPSVGRHIISSGIVSRMSASAKNVHGFWHDERPAFQLHAVFCQGFEGAPVLNSRGEVLGIILEHVPGLPSLATAKPVAPVLRSVREIIDTNASVARALLGCTFMDGIEPGQPGAVKVVGVSAQGAAERAGLRRGDIVQSIARTKIDSADALTVALATMRAGHQVEIVVERGGEPATISAMPRPYDWKPSTTADCESRASPKWPYMTPLELPQYRPQAPFRPPEGLTAAAGVGVLPGALSLHTMDEPSLGFSGFCTDAELHVVTVGSQPRAGVPVAARGSEGGLPSLRLIGRDPWTDTAVLKAKDGLAPVTPVMGGPPDPGEPLFVLGSVRPEAALSLLMAFASPEPTWGRDRMSDPLGIPRYERIVAQFFPGCEGAPVLTPDGCVLGMLRSAGPAGEDFTWIEPIADVLESAREVIEAEGMLKRPVVGVRFDSSLPIGDAWQAVVAEVDEDSPASTAGLRPGDVISKVNESATATPHQLWRAWRQLRADIPAVLDVRRNGEEMEIELVPDPPDRAAAQ